MNIDARKSRMAHTGCQGSQAKATSPATRESTTPTARAQDAHETWKLLPADGEAGDRFGDEVAISGKIAVLGAPGEDPSVARVSGAGSRAVGLRRPPLSIDMGLVVIPRRCPG